MRSISIRNVPDGVYIALQEIARSNHRSLQEQIKYILEQEVRLVRGSPLAEAAKWRKRFKGRKFTDTVEMIRRDRRR
jgi:plasmid stability protein